METDPLLRSRSSTNTHRILSRESNDEDEEEEEVQTTFCCCPVKVENYNTPGEEYGHLDAKLESLNYDNCENEIYMNEERAKSYKFREWKAFSRWVVMLLIGVSTALIACLIDLVVEEVSFYKFQLLVQNIVAALEVDTETRMMKPLFLWVCWNVIFVAMASFLTVYGEPVSGGSGIPQIKCFLNGIKIPNVVRIKALICKVVGVTCSVLGGLVVGKEGPMIHAGAVVAAGISQGRSATLGFDLKIFEYFRTDQEKRDFVSAGAAAGVSAAFGTPVGGVLFSLEEAASFWDQALTWRIFFASLVSTFTLNIVLSAYHGGKLSYTGLVNFGKFQDMSNTFYEIPVFMLLGLIGGLLGALYNAINFRLTLFRMKNVSKSWLKYLEALFIASSTTAVAFVLIYLVDDCQPIGKDRNPNPLKLFCPDGKSSSMATLWFQSPESSLRSLFHDSFETYTWYTLCLFGLFYFLLASWTYGMAVSSGLFIPCLVIGASWGRLFGLLFKVVFPYPSDWVQPGKFALLGAAAQLGGTVRMTLSLTVILLEATGNISYGLPLMIVLNIAKWTADIFNQGIYDSHIHLQGIPFLHTEPPPMTSSLIAREVMSHPVVVVGQVESVSNIVHVLSHENHNAFPVVINDQAVPRTRVESPLGNIDCDSFGLVTGLITRSQLIVLLKKKHFIRHDDVQESLKLSHFREVYPRYPSVHNVDLTEDDMTSFIDLRSVMNPAPYIVYDNTSLHRIFKLFRGLGLSHLMVVNKYNLLIGMVTRKDLARYHCHKANCCSKPVLYQLPMTTHQF